MKQEIPAMSDEPEVAAREHARSPREGNSRRTINDPYAPAQVWNTYFAAYASAGKELNPEGWWVPDFLPFLHAAHARHVLDVGCGMGGDAVSLAQHGFQVTAVDYSAVALTHARAKAAAAGVGVEFHQRDMALPLPFGAETFDAVMSNVALHMFDDPTTRRIVGEMRRVVRSKGLLLLHVNSIEDLPYRSDRMGRRRVQVLGPDFYREANGQTVHFFSEEYCRDILADWTILELTHLRLRDEADTIFKCVWHCIAQKPADTISR
jgi:SAM-dependent methyltransferase